MWQHALMRRSIRTADLAWDAVKFCLSPLCAEAFQFEYVVCGRGACALLAAFLTFATRALKILAGLPSYPGHGGPTAASAGVVSYPVQLMFIVHKFIN